MTGSGVGESMRMWVAERRAEQGFMWSGLVIWDFGIVWRVRLLVTPWRDRLWLDR